MSKDVRFITIPEDEDGQRLDRWLKKCVPGLPYVLAQKLMRKGAIRVGEEKVQPSRRLRAGEIVRIPPFEEGQTSLATLDRFPDDESFIRSLVIYDDGEVMAINKPAGLASQGGSKIRRHVDGLLEHLANKKGVKPRLVHRLDRDTSGVLLLARSLDMATKLGKALAGRNIRKIYWAVTIPAPEMNEGTVNAPLAKGTGPKKDMMIVDEENGKRSMTDFRVIERAGKTAAFVAFWPRTGRTHQIRVHAALAGFPLLGDDKYGEGKAILEGVETARRLHLHAHRVIFTHPGTGKTVDISAPLPDDLKITWKALGFPAKQAADPFAERDL